MTASSLDKARLAPLLEVPLAQRIFTALAKAEGEARFVGGIVRDALTGMAFGADADLDMAMTLPPDLATTVLTDAGLRVLPPGIDHGTITVFDRRDDRRKVELTTLRQDMDTDGRHAVVSFGQDWATDAARRDFTFNSIYLAADGTLFDPFDGRADLAAGRVRFIGTAAARIEEDHLRILRFFRFQARFGAGAPDPDAMAAITAARTRLDGISGERIAKELAGLLALGPSRGLSALVAAGVDQVILPRGFDLTRFERLAALDTALEASGEGDRPLAAAYTALTDDHEGLAARLKSSGKLRGEMAYLAAEMPMIARFGQDDWAQYAWAEKPAGAMSLAMLGWRYAVQAVAMGGEADPAVMARLMRWTAPEFPLQGRDLMALGVAPGAGMGAMLKAAEKQWVKSGFTLTRDELLMEIRAKKLDAGAAKS